MTGGGGSVVCRPCRLRVRRAMIEGMLTIESEEARANRLRVAWAWDEWREPGAITKAEMYDVLTRPIPALPLPPPILTWPTRASVGVPEDVKLLRAPSGRVTEAGAILDSLEIIGMLTIAAPDVRIRRSRVKLSDTSGPGAYPIKVDGSVPDGHGPIIEDSELDGNARAGVGVGFNNYTLRRTLVHNSVDGLRADGLVVVEDSLITDLARTPGSHNDGIQTLKGREIHVDRTTIDVYDEGDLPGPEDDDPHNACFIISAGASGGPVEDVSFQDCWFEGGNYGIYGGKDGEHPVTKIQIRRNTFARGKFRYGPVTALADPSGFDRLTNLYDDGKPVLS